MAYNKRYVILGPHIQYNLACEVATYLNAGWVCVGGPVIKVSKVEYDDWYQAMQYEHKPPFPVPTEIGEKSVVLKGLQL